MGALPNISPVRLDQYGRDPNSPSETLRRKTNYDKGTGYGLLFYAMAADVPRLSSGKACTDLLWLIQALADRSNSERRGWTDFQPLEYWAQLAHCDVKQVQRVRDYLKARKMADIQTDTKRRISFRLRLQGWQALEDYSTWFAQQPRESDDEPDQEDPATPDVARKPGRWRLKRPAKVKPGQKSRAFPIDVGVASIRFENPNSVDLAYDAVVKAGELVVIPVVNLKASNATGQQKAKSEATTTGYESRRGHGRPPEFASSSPASKGRTISEHPLAPTLAALFDPLLLRSCGKSLSSDPKALQLACEAAVSIDHAYLVKYVIERFDRPVASPRFAVGIVKDAAKDFEKSKNLPPAQRVAKRSPQPEKKAGFRERLQAEAARRIKEYGRI